MAKHTPKLETVSIVLLGDFNPTIIQPSWLSHHKLIRERESTEAKVVIINPDIVQFSIEDFFNLSITRNSFIISANLSSQYEPIRDLTLAIFELLAHTPLTKMGINLEKHFLIESTDEWHLFGNSLVPKETWESIFNKPGLRTLVIEEDDRQDNLKGLIRAKIEPSTSIHPGIYFHINDHIENDSELEYNDSSYLMKTLKKVWSDSITRSENIINDLLKSHA